MTDENHHTERQILSAPAPSSPYLPQGVVSVECEKDEDVEWIWTETSEGRFVSGFKVVKKDEA